MEKKYGVLLAVGFSCKRSYVCLGYTNHPDILLMRGGSDRWKRESWSMTHWHILNEYDLKCVQCTYIEMNVGVVLFKSPEAK